MALRSAVDPSLLLCDYQCVQQLLIAWPAVPVQYAPSVLQISTQVEELAWVMNCMFDICFSLCYHLRFLYHDVDMLWCVCILQLVQLFLIASHVTVLRHLVQRVTLATMPRLAPASVSILTESNPVVLYILVLDLQCFVY